MMSDETQSPGCSSPLPSGRSSISGNPGGANLLVLRVAGQACGLRS